jgi:hypothetical protein
MVRGIGGIGDRSMMGLSCGEQLVVWSIRRIVVRQGPDPDLIGDFGAVFGGEEARGFEVFCGFFRSLGEAARRPYEIAPPSTLRVMRDEQRILTLLAAAQMGLDSGDHALFEAHLLWMAVQVHRPALFRFALEFARLLAGRGYRIALAPAFESGAEDVALFLSSARA